MSGHEPVHHSKSDTAKQVTCSRTNEMFSIKQAGTLPKTYPENPRVHSTDTGAQEAPGRLFVPLREASRPGPREDRRKSGSLDPGGRAEGADGPRTQAPHRWPCLAPGALRGQVRCSVPGWLKPPGSAARGVTPVGTTACGRPPSGPEGCPQLCLLPSVPQNSWARHAHPVGRSFACVDFGAPQGFAFKEKKGVVEDEMFRWHR